jgi:AcrR family transcriptional regulator
LVAKGPRGQARKAEAEAAILDAAERLFARHGIEGVSLRQIGAAAGSANNFGVQYHFGDKARLIRAIFERRLPSLEARRAQLLEAAEHAGAAGDPRTLLGVMLRPIVEEVDGSGGLSYARFLVGLRHFDGELDVRLAALELAPLTNRLDAMLRASAPQLPAELQVLRAVRAYRVFLDAVVDWDRARAGATPSRLGQADAVEEALDEALGCFLAPVSPQVAARLV